MSFHKRLIFATRTQIQPNPKVSHDDSQLSIDSFDFDSVGSRIDVDSVGSRQHYKSGRLPLDPFLK
jgi:hypothetical protein